MIRVDETDPVGEIEPSFPYRDVSIRRGVEFKDHYDIQSEIGRGKFGTVYRCKDKENGLSLAAKVVNTTRKEDRRSVEREVEIMRRLQHPRLIQLYDAIDTGRQIYVILELIEGGELFERVIDDDFVLTERSCAVFMRQICEGIEFIHAQNILHLDLKPENILCLTKEGNRIKIIDFGLARQFDPRKKLQVLFGTPEFVAPEVVNFDQIGFGTDMWSVGVICYVLLSGLSPFMGDTDVETMANVTIAKYDFDHEAFQDISEEAKDFIKCLLVKDKEKRATAKQCREHRWLFRKKAPVLEQKPVATTPSAPRPASRWNDVDRNELDVAKDNLRLFVERWREHPDSPYSIEIAPDNGILIRDHRNREPKTAPPIVDSLSLCGQSPSPCGSLCSSSDATNSPRENQSFFLRVPSFASYERRASEGTSENSRDPASQIVLAEEIIKLSEHLRSIAMSSKVADQAGSGEPTSDKSEKRAVSSGKFTANPQSEQNVSNEITQRLTSIAKQRQENGTTFNRNWHESKMSRRLESTKDMEIPNNKKTMDLTPPWRRSRAKHRFGETCRDVPRISSLRDFHKNLTLDEPTSTKNLLLHLLEEWEDVNSRSSDIGRKSISIDWCGEDSVARRSMNSLAEYFQAEQQHESAMNNSVSTTSVHR